MRPRASIGLISLLCTTALACGDDTIPGAGSSDSSGGSTGSSSAPVTLTLTMSTDPTMGTTTDPSTTDATATTATTVVLDSSGTDSSSSSEGSSSESTGDPAPEIEVSVEGVAVPDGGSHDLSETVDVGMAGTPVEVVIENVGTATLGVMGASITAGDDTHFTIDAGALDPMVGPGDQTSFTVTFTPGNGGLKGISLTIDNDDADEAPYELDLRAHSTPNTWRNITPGGSPPARFNTAMTDLGDGRLLLFGGRLGNGFRLDDQWVYDIEAGSWTEAMPMVAPPFRDAHRMVHAGGDTVILFGGNTQNFGGPAVIYDDTWAYDIPTETWMDMAPGAPPPGRFQHAMAAIADDTVLLFGGRIQFGNYLGDTWIYDGVANTWTDTAPAGGIPARAVAAMGFDGTNTVTLFGGFGSLMFPDDPYGDTWNYDVAANTWTQGMPMTTPGPRLAMSGAYFESGSFIVHSGKLGNCCVDPSPGTFAYDPAADDWADLAPAPEPVPRFNYAIAYVPGDNKLIMFGGLFNNLDQSSTTQETWEYVGPWP